MQNTEDKTPHSLGGMLCCLLRAGLGRLTLPAKGRVSLGNKEHKLAPSFFLCQSVEMDINRSESQQAILWLCSVSWMEQVGRSALLRPGLGVTRGTSSPRAESTCGPGTLL